MISESNNYDSCQFSGTQVMDCTSGDELMWVRSDEWHYQYKSYLESSFQRRGEAWRKEWRLTFREEYKGGRARLTTSEQWLKCNGTQGNAIPPPPIYGSKRSPPQIVIMLGKGTRPRIGGSNLNVPFSHLKFCTLTTASEERVLWWGKDKIIQISRLRACFIDLSLDITKLNFGLQTNMEDDVSKILIRPSKQLWENTIWWNPGAWFSKLRKIFIAFCKSARYNFLRFS